MKRSIAALVLAAFLFALFGCAEPAEPAFVDTLPCNAQSGYTWVIFKSAGNTGDIDAEQTYRDDETYAQLGASGVLENTFTGVSPGKVTLRLYYVQPDSWNGLRSSADGAAYYEFQVDDDLSIRLLYSEVEFPDGF